MDWPNERYVRIYTRDTRTTKLIGWEGRAVLWETIRKADRSGLLEGVRTAEDLALMVDIPVEVVAVALKRMLSVGAVEVSDMGLVVPNYIPAQETPQSDRQRQKESRARRAEKARVTNCDAMASRNVTENNESVTPSHTESHDVTPCHSVPSRAVPSRADDSCASKSRPSSQQSKPVELPEDWKPDPDQVKALAQKHEATESRVLAQVPEFIFYWRKGKGAGKRRSTKGWALAFGKRVDQQASSGFLYGRDGGQSGQLGLSTTAEDLGFVS